MEVPVINNLNDGGDRLRAKGKDAFKDQQKESEVRGSEGKDSLLDVLVSERRACACVDVCCCCWGSFWSS